MLCLEEYFKMKTTIRECGECGYRTMISQDSGKGRKCKYCDGLLKIVMSEKLNIGKEI